MFIVGYLVGTLIFAIVYGGAKLILDNIELNQRFEKYEKEMDELGKRMVEEREEVRKNFQKNT